MAKSSKSRSGFRSFGGAPKSARISLMDGQAFAQNTGRALVVVHISRQEIDDCQTASAYDRLLVMIDSKDNVERYRESVVFQVFGFDQDPRELCEIPEVRRYFERLTNDWGHWLWFLKRDHAFVRTLLSLVTPCSVVRQGDRLGIDFYDSNALHRTLNHLWGRTAIVLDQYGIPKAVQQAVLDRAVKDLSAPAVKY